MEQGLKRFVGKAVLITGAGSGIGRGISLRLAQEGADIAVSDLVAEKVQETVQMVEACGQKALALPADVGNLQEMEQAAHKAIGVFGKIDILVNNAGTGDTNMSFEDIEAELWERIYATNVKGPFFLTKTIARDMISKGVKGKIINIASTEGKTNRAGSLVYASSKSALIGLTQGLAIQLSPYDITVNVVCPGLIDTPIWHRGDKVMDLPPGSMIKMVVDTAIEQRLLKIARVGTPDDIAGAVSFLASDDASYMTGQAINVCGGMEFH